MNCLDRFNNKMKLNGGSLRNENVFNSRKLLDETFSDDASFFDCVYFWELGKKDYENDTPIGIRLYDRAYSNANGVMTHFQTLYNTPVVVGDIVYNMEDNSYLICTESFNIDDVHYQGKLTLCNWILKWQNEHGDILEYPCYDINSTQYNSGEQSNRQFTVGSSQHLLILPSDENTITLSSPRRFYLDKNTIKPTSFIVTQNDSTSNNYGKKGIVRLTVYEYENDNETDRPDLGICDYNEFISSGNTGGADNVYRSVIYYDTDIIKSGGDFQTFTAKFFDDNNNEITTSIPKWSVVCDFKNELDISTSGNDISISIDNDDYVDEDFKIELTDTNGNYYSSIIVKVESIL